ncbi:MAG: TIGR02757 family protein [Bacteroidia bacterium]|nr:TIGR02757 family protein [Bacteroidia bacterium]
MTIHPNNPVPDSNPGDELHHLLDQKYVQYNTPAFIGADPVSIPHLFETREDIEIAGFFSALIAWGQRLTIIRNARALMARMDMAPYAFVQGAGPEELARLDDFVHRTFNGVDARSLVLALRAVYLAYGSLEAIFAVPPTASDVMPGLLRARTILTSTPDFAPRTHKHIADPSRGSSAKRLNMYLRWMVRRDTCGVDFGLWTAIQPAQLICPLDVHTGNVARKLGLLTRTQDDWQAALALTEALRLYCPEDPVRYDFSLFGLGVNKEV